MLNTRTSMLVLGTLTLLLTTLACTATTSLIQPDPSPSATSSTRPVASVSCTMDLTSILDTASLTESLTLPEEESHLVTYPVSGNTLGEPYYGTVSASLQDEQSDLQTQQDIWNYFTTIIPEDQRQFLTQYSILTDGQDNLLAAVAQTYDDPTHWVLEVDIADSKDYDDLTFTLIHEFGHLLTLNAEQVTPSMPVFDHPGDPQIHKQEAALCPNYFAGEGCSESSSYINQFYQQFWADKYAEWNRVDTTHDEFLYYERLNEFYKKYKDQFVTDYAATNPGEDIAESWAYFVLSPKPQGNTIAEQKILFFYERPELVQLRQEILNNLCSAYPWSLQ